MPEIRFHGSDNNRLTNACAFGEAQRQAQQERLEQLYPTAAPGIGEPAVSSEAKIEPLELPATTGIEPSASAHQPRPRFEFPILAEIAADGLII